MAVAAVAADASPAVEVLPGLWLGGLPDESPPSRVYTHVLSVLPGGGGGEGSLPMATIKATSAQRHPVVLRLPVTDEEDTDLLQHLRTTTAWLDEAFSSSPKSEASPTPTPTILVHCVSGISRSPTVVAAYLITKRAWGVEEALTFLRARKPDVSPNPGFQEQLRVWQDMGGIWDPLHPGYARLQRQWKYGPLYAHPSQQQRPSTLAASVEGGQGQPTQRLHCKRCRTPLPFAEVQHAPGGGQGSFSYHKRDTAIQRMSAPEGSATRHPCHTWFSDALPWMYEREEAETGALAGKITCPKAGCDAKLGQWAWSGLQCSCGFWVSPGFSLAKSKVDASRSGPS
jgi:dual specificity phosphatase 12